MKKISVGYRDYVLYRLCALQHLLHVFISLCLSAHLLCFCFLVRVTPG